jgi:phage FluMu protein gp41
MDNERFDFTLPVSKQKVVLRRSTLLDEVKNDEDFSAEEAKESLRPWNLIGRTIVELGGKKGPLSGEDLIGLASQDGAYLLAFWAKLNSLTPKMRAEIDGFFEIPATGSSPS